MPNDIENRVLGRYLYEASLLEQNKKETIEELYNEWNEMRKTYYGYHLDANNKKYDNIGKNI